MFRINKDLQKHPEDLKHWGFILEPTHDGYSFKDGSVELYIPIRSYDVFREYYVYVITDSATVIEKELDKLIVLFEYGVLENVL